MIAYCPLEDLEPRQQEVVASVPQKEVPEIGAEDTASEIVQKVFRTAMQALDVIVCCMKEGFRQLHTICVW